MTPAYHRARSTDHATSHEAGQMAESFAATHRARIMVALRDGPGTIYRIANLTGLSHVDVARRMTELHRLGAAETTGETRETPSGRRARVWRVAE